MVFPTAQSFPNVIYDNVTYGLMINNCQGQRLSWTKAVETLFETHPLDVRIAAWFSYRTFWWSATGGSVAQVCDQSKLFFGWPLQRWIISAGRRLKKLVWTRPLPCSWWHVPCNKQVRFQIAQPFSWIGFGWVQWHQWKCSWTQLKKKRNRKTMSLVNLDRKRK